ncbi:MAG: hypothetical protein AB7T06_20325 [Kofleriaceae bacterium]
MAKDKSKAKKKDQSYTKKEVNLANFFDDAVPTVFEGGLDRMVQIWNDLRKRNTGAYGSGVVSIIDGWGQFGKSCTTVTACSPFTANTIGIMFDPQGSADGRSKPMFTSRTKGTIPLPVDFYQMHQGNYSGPLPKGVSKGDVNHSAESILAYNLGYEIQAKDLRRGDMVGIDWSNGNGHAVFVWDVHVKTVGDHEETDAFSYISANGSIIIKYDPDDPPMEGKPTKSAITKKDRKRLYKTFTGAGISIGGCATSTYFSNAKDTKTLAKDRPKDWTLKMKSIDGQPFFADRKEHIQDAHWYCIPRTHKDDIDKTTWKEGGPKLGVIDYTFPGNYVRSLRAVRFWGFPPPDRKAETNREGTDFELAKQYAAKTGWKLKESYATGTGPVPKPTIIAVQPSNTKGDVEKIKDAPPKKAEQPKKPEQYTKQQLWVEEMLGTLFDHDWLDTDPGDRGNPNDDASKKAIKEFQEKWKITPINGVAGPKTRDGLEEASKKAIAGELPPWKKEPPAPKTKLDRIVWLKNRVLPGGEIYFAVHGIVSKLSRLEITFKDRKSSKVAKMPCDIETDASGIIERPIGIPKDFTDGAELLATFDGTSGDGVKVHFESKVPLYVGGAPAALAAQ